MQPALQLEHGVVAGGGLAASGPSRGFECTPTAQTPATRRMKNNLIARNKTSSTETETDAAKYSGTRLYTLRGNYRGFYRSRRKYYGTINLSHVLEIRNLSLFDRLEGNDRILIIRLVVKN